MVEFYIAGTGVCIQIHHLEIIEGLNLNLWSGRARRKTRSRVKIHLALRRSGNLILVCKKAHTEVIAEFNDIVATDINLSCTRSKGGQLRNGWLR